jgi:hypothetical protein
VLPTLFDVLGSFRGPAGVDRSATAFDRDYQPAVRTVVDGVNRAVNLLNDLGVGIDTSAYNHWKADADATPGGGQPPPWQPVDPGLVLPQSFAAPSLVGSPTAILPPPLSDMIPMGHTDDLRALAGAFQNAHDTLDSVTTELHNALEFLFSNNQSADLDAMNEFWDRIGGPGGNAILSALPNGCDSIANAIYQYADWIDETQNQIIDAIGNFLEDATLGALGAILLGMITDGIGAIAGIAKILDDVGEGSALVVAIDGIVAAASGRLAAVGAVAAGAVGSMTAAINNTPDPNVGSADSQSTAPSDADETQAAEDLANRITTQSPEHLRDLGTDPETGQFRQSEADTGGRIEDELGITLTRVTDGSGADWRGSDGSTYDAVGNFPSQYFDSQWKNLQNQIVRHLDFKADRVPVDVSQFTPQQVATVKQFIAQFAPRAFLVGE